jgi:hypothetical protein
VPATRQRVPIAITQTWRASSSGAANGSAGVANRRATPEPALDDAPVLHVELPAAAGVCAVARVAPTARTCEYGC